MRIAILGFGKEGKSLKKILRALPRYRNAKLEILDRSLNASYLKHLNGFDLIFRSPGIPYNLEELSRARARRIKISSATKLFFELVENDIKIKKQKPIIIGITGTKGKGTTATLLYTILKAANKRVYLGGNIGTPALSLISELQKQLSKRPYVILELSSFQLHDLTASPRIALVLELFPDHLDHHKNLKEYYAAKTSITKYQKQGDSSFYFQDDKQSARIGCLGKGKHIPINAARFSLFKETDLRLKGGHNFKNAVAAATVARALTIPSAIIKRAVRDFRGTPHRLELIRSLRIHNHKDIFHQIDFYNDSASTNPHTTRAAISAFSNRPVILIIGGQDKNLDYTPLTTTLKKSSVQRVILIGENKQKIARAVKSSKIPFVFAPTLKDALQESMRHAKTLIAHRQTLNPVILFSPGAASFDMFKNYSDRGEQFKRIVKTLRKP